MVVPAKKYKMKLRSLLVAALLLILLPAVVTEAWFSYHTAQKSSAKFQAQLASEVSAQVFDKVAQFFEVPNRVVRYNSEQFRVGLMEATKREDMQRHFLLQLEQQPLLTFLSMGTVQGEYFSASRPPLGEDRALRLLQATEADGRLMTLYRVNERHQRGALISSGNTYFDARTRPWFKVAMGYNRAHWYPVYRYVINDSQGAYDAVGIGISAPLYNPAGHFVGVLTADVALVQLSQLLGSVSKELGGTAFLFDEGGDLLATSTLESLYELKGNATVRVKAIDSPNPVIRAASAVILASTESQGRTVKGVDGESYLLDWQQHVLPDGPTITVANILPQRQFDAPSRDLLFNIFLFSGGVVVACLILAIFLSQWIARPLVDLGNWATKLGRGDGGGVKHRTSPIAEVESLTNALQLMADSVNYHTDHLEQEVAVRTAELELANRELAKLSITDGLTGVANRRYFDEVLAQEVARTRRLQQPLALILLDVDEFKKYNDHYGHPAGDQCLIQVARLLKSNTQRPSDLAARYGGEEFAVIAAHTDTHDAWALAEVLRSKIEQLGIPHGVSTAGVVTASLGVAVFIPDDAHSAMQLIQMADEALYRAKKQGRNRVELAPLLTPSSDSNEGIRPAVPVEPRF